jgi:hypothetical protein
MYRNVHLFHAFRYSFRIATAVAVSFGTALPFNKQFSFMMMREDWDLEQHFSKMRILQQVQLGKLISIIAHSSSIHPLPQIPRQFLSFIPRQVYTYTIFSQQRVHI